MGEIFNSYIILGIHGILLLVTTLRNQNVMWIFGTFGAMMQYFINKHSNINLIKILVT